MLAGTVAALFALTVGAWVFFAPPWQPGYKPVSPGPLQQQWLVNLNTAGLDALCTLPGIGAARAQAILDYRAEHGPFHSLDEVEKVKGISEKTIQGWQGLAYVE